MDIVYDFIDDIDIAKGQRFLEGIKAKYGELFQEPPKPPPPQCFCSTPLPSLTSQWRCVDDGDGVRLYLYGEDGDLPECDVEHLADHMYFPSVLSIFVELYTS